MPTSYTTLLGLAKPATGELSGTWGTTVNNYITDYVDSAVAGAQVISGTQTAVTLSTTNGSSLTQAGSGAAGSAQYAIIRCTGSPAGLLTITVPAADKVYLVINATSTNQSVKVVGLGPTTGVTVAASRAALIAWNGSDFALIATTDITQLSGTLAVANGGTGITSFGTGVATALGQNVTGSGGIALGISSGTYTPTLTSVANVVSTTAETCMYTNVQGVVTVYGRFGIQFNAGTVQVGISLPIASDFTSSNNCIGFPTIVLSGVILAYPPFIFIKADTTNNRADLYYRANSGVTGSDSEMYFNFAYRVI